MKVGIGCLAFLTALAAVTVFVDRLISASLPPELHYFVVLPAGVCLTLGLSNLWSLLRGYGSGAASRDAVLERARRGEAPAGAGSIVATGIVRAEGETLRAPISGTECVAYQYRLYVLRMRAGRKRHEVPIYWGYASRPFRIDTVSQAFRVLAVPRLADKATSHDSPEARARAQAYVSSTRFETMSAIAGVASTVATSFGEQVDEPSGAVRHDWKAEGSDVAIESLRIEETVVPVGATVSVAGRWAAERRAIVPGEIADGELGVTAEELGRSGSSELPWSRLSVAVTAGFLLLVGSALVWLSTTGRIAQWWRAR